jgi:hypothetical protein
LLIVKIQDDILVLCQFSFCLLLGTSFGNGQKEVFAYRNMIQGLHKAHSFNNLSELGNNAEVALQKGTSFYMILGQHDFIYPTLNSNIVDPPLMGAPLRVLSLETAD